MEPGLTTMEKIEKKGKKKDAGRRITTCGVK